MQKIPNKILVIQTAFIGDVILATALLEALHREFPKAELHFLVRKSNESLLSNNPFLQKVWTWDKKNGKYPALYRLRRAFRAEKFDWIINLQRYASTGWLATRSRADKVFGFSKNPYALLMSRTISYDIKAKAPLHEVDRNLKLVGDAFLSKYRGIRPKLYPSKSDFEKVSGLALGKYVVLAPSSVWYTKAMAPHKWTDLVKQIDSKYQIVFIGAQDDYDKCEEIMLELQHKNYINLCGNLSLLQSAAIMQNASRCFVNDSAPLHLASSMNAKTTAVFCSTVPKFGFGPLADDSIIIEVEEKLACRPCGIHGYKVCPQGHFKCSEDIKINNLVRTIG